MIPAPCVGRCEVAPCVVVHQNAIGECDAWTACKAAVSQRKSSLLKKPKYIDYAQYRKAGGYKLIADCLAGKHKREDITKIMEDSGLRGLGGAGFPGRPQVAPGGRRAPRRASWR